MSELLDHGIHMIRSIGALKLKGRADYVQTAEGTVIRQHGRPDLLITWEAAREFSNMVQEAQA